MKLSDLLKVMGKNDLIYCNECAEEGGWMMRGNEWDTETANKWMIAKVFINSKWNLQCYVVSVDDEKYKPSIGAEMVWRMIEKQQEVH